MSAWRGCAATILNVSGCAHRGGVLPGYTASRRRRPAGGGSVTLSAGCVTQVVQRRGYSTPPQGGETSMPEHQSQPRMSTVKRIENLVAGKSASGERAKVTNVSLDQAFRRQRNRVMKVGSAAEKDHWDRLGSAWRLIPTAKKTRVVTTDTDASQLNEILKLIEETGALDKVLAQHAEAQEVKERDHVDEIVIKGVCVAIVIVVLLSFISIHQMNSAKEAERKSTLSERRKEEQ